MQDFQKILIAVDLSSGDRFVGESLPRPTEQAICQAEWMALSFGGSIDLLYVLPPEADQLSWDRQLLMGEGDKFKSVKDHAEDVLKGIGEKLARKGIQISTKVAIGKSWLEVIRSVVQNGNDLVIAGTRSLGPFRSLLFGSTGIKLLRQCPCPVLITKPSEGQEEWIRSILVAHDLTPVGDRALNIAISIASRRNCHVHVLHVIEHVGFTRPGQINEDQARRQINERLETQSSGVRSTVCVTEGSPASEILDYVKRNDIDLLAMGTIANSGIAGVFVGNTAEKVLPFLTCSILAVKPRRV